MHGDEAGTPPPYRIETERLVIRCWHPRDAPLLKDAIESSLEQLRRWMPWAAEEPQPLAAKVELLRRFRGRFDLDQDYAYGIFSADESEVVGGTGLHTRVGPGAFEIGYWVRTTRTRSGVATEAAAALTRAGIEIGGADRIEIHVEPANEASAGVPRKLGYRHEATLGRRLPPPAGEQVRRDKMVFTLFAEELARAAAGGVRLAAFDAAGSRVL